MCLRVKTRLKYIHFFISILLLMVYQCGSDKELSLNLTISASLKNYFNDINQLYYSGEQAGEILNFGAFLAFMGVNLATFWQFTIMQQSGRKRRWLADVVMPLVGFLFCLWIWLGLKVPAKVVGGVWFMAGFVYYAIKTRGFRTKPVMIDFSEA